MAMEGSQSTGQAYAKEVEEATRKLNEALLEWQSETEPSQLSQFPLRTLTWLALTPVWPLDLAEKGFPLDGHNLASGPLVTRTLTEIASAQFCEFGSSDSGSGELFWMSAVQQSAVLDFLQTRPDDESHSLGVRGYIRARLKEASSAMVSAAHGKSLTSPLQRWIELAQNAGDDESITKLLRDKVETALADAKSHGQIISPEALRWIEAAKPFVRWLGTPMEWALAQGGRRLELFYREAYDGRSLKNYFIRDYQEQAFKDLLEGADPTAGSGTTDPNPFWALHYVGLGGTGKTMLMRRISSQLADKMGLAVARVDFDRLNPDYPSRAPGLLLMGFAEELRLRATEIVPDIFEKFDKEVETLHETIKEGYESNVPVNVPVDALVDDTAFQRVLRPFIEAVRRLSSQKRVVLVLDTCEELAKMRSDGSLPDSVRVTFDILQRIHSHVESLRVVFSGRRPLASAGHLLGREEGAAKEYKWTCPVSKLPERDYLRLYEIRGFTRDEALDFLKQYGGEAGAKVNPALFEAIIGQSCSADKSFDSRFEWHDGRIETDTDPRYNPYDLDMFAEWASSDPKVGEKEIKEGATAYVKDRIIKRADHKIRRLLPEIVLLGRFDEKMIRKLVAAKGGNFDAFFTELISQEWLDVDRNATQTGTVWAMDSIMRQRLSEYYQSEEPSTFSKASATIAEFLSQLTIERDWKELSTAYFESALSALLHNKTKAARWWDEVDKKLAQSANWAWARNLTDQLLEDDGLAARADATLGDKVEAECVLRPAIRATQAAALTHLLFTSPEVNREGLLDIWSEVLEKAQRHPTGEGAQRLRYRAIAGKAAAYRWQYDLHSPQLLDTNLVELFELLPRTSDFKDESSATSEIAMLEALVEICESLALEYGSTEDPQFTRKLNSIHLKYYERDPIWWSDSLPQDVQAFYLTLAGRLRILCGLPQVADTFHRALELLKEADSFKALQRHLDWHHPEDVTSRILLEFIRAMYPAYAEPEDILRQVEGYMIMTAKPAPESITIDSDRLLSATLLLRSHSRLEPSRTTEYNDEVINHSVAQQISAPDCNAHRAFPPLFAPALETRFACLQVDRAVEQCREISKRAENSKPPLLHVQKTADRSLMRMAAQLHLRDERRMTIGGSLNESNLLSDLSLRFYLNALDGAKSNEMIEPYLQRESDEKRRATLAHIGWRSGKTDVTALLASLHKNNSSDSAIHFALALDAVESIYLSIDRAKDSGGVVQSWPEAVETSGMASQWAQSHPSQPVEALTLCLRAGVLAPETPLSNVLYTPISQELLDALIRRVGKRRTADIAFEEGYLLAQKLPKRGLQLLRMAHDWYDQSNDSLGQFVSTLSVAMLEAGLQDEAKLRQSIETMKDEYLLVEAEGPLPAWEMLLAATTAKEGLHRILTSLESSPNWRPCLVRVLGCLIRQQEFSSRSSSTKSLQAWLEENYSTIVQDRSYLPPDLTYLLTYKDSTVVFSGEVSQTTYHSFSQPVSASSAAASASAPSKRRSSILKTVPVVLGGLGTLIGVILVSGYLVRFVFSYLFPISRGWSLFIGLLLIILVSRISALWRWFTSRAVTMWQRTSSIESEGAIKDANHPLLSSLKMRMQVGPFSKDLSLTVVKSSIDDSYRQLAQTIPEVARRTWTRANTYAGKRYLDMKVIVAEDNAAAPWEAILGLPSEEIKTFEQSRVMCRRTLRVRGVSRLSPVILPLKILTLASNVSQAGLAEESWRIASSATRTERSGDSVSHSVEKPSSYFTGARQRGRTSSDVHVLHLFGTPRQTSSGLRLELSGVDGGYGYDIASTTESVRIQESSTGSIRMQERKGSSVKGGRSRSYLLQAEEIAGTFPALKICLVQSEPLMDEFRDSTTRDEAGLLRRFGAELFKCGIPAIVLLPPLPETIAVETIRILDDMLTRQVARGLSRWWRGRTPLPRTVRTMQEIIGSGRSYENQETAIEVAFDLCLYMVDEFDLDVRPAPPLDYPAARAPVVPPTSADWR